METQNLHEEASGVSAKEKAALLKAARKAAWEECLPIIREITEPCFRIRVTPHKDGSKTVEPDVGRPSRSKYGNAWVIYKDGRLASMHRDAEPELGYSPPRESEVIRNEAIIEICNRHAANLYKAAGNEVRQGKFLYMYKFIKGGVTHDDRCGYGLIAFVACKYARGMLPRIKGSSIGVMRKALFDNLNQDVLLFSKKVGATFKKTSLWIEANNLIVDFLPLYKRVLDDQPRAIPAFHAILMDGKVSNALPNLPSADCEPIKWAKDMLFQRYGLSSASWRHLLTCNAAERTTWLSFPLLYRRFALLNRVTGGQIPVTATLISKYGTDDAECAEDRYSLVLDYKESLLRHLHARIKNGSLRNNISIRDAIHQYDGKHIHSYLVFDYITKSNNIAAPPKGAGVKWWNAAQAAWHADIAITEAKRGRRMFDWTDAYPSEIQYFEKDGMKAHVISTTLRLIQEGLDLNHCVALYDQSCMYGDEYIYSITFVDEKGKDNRATGRVSNKAHGVYLSECRSYHNGDVPSAVHDFAKDIADRLRAILMAPGEMALIPGTLMLHGIPPKLIEEAVEELCHSAN